MLCQALRLYCIFMFACIVELYSAEKKSKGGCIRLGFLSAPNAAEKGR
jgi:hypothetical protein